MKLFKKIGFILLFLWSCNGYAQTSVKVYLLAGQSNMVGWNSLNTELPAVLQAQQTAQIKVFGNNTYNWGNVRPGLGKDAENFGPEIAFAWDISKHYNGENIAIIKGAWPSTSLYKNWRPPSSGRNSGDGDLYDQYVSKVNAALTELRAKYNKVEIAGMCWMQGESDCDTQPHAKEYQANLTNFIKDLRTAFNTPNLPFVIGMIDNSTPWVYSTAVRAGETTVAQTVSNVYAFDTKDYRSDSYHYYTSGQLQLGADFASTLINRDFSNLTNGVKGKSGTYYLKNQFSGQYFDLSGGNLANNAPFAQYSYNGGGNQQYKLEEVEDGIYKVTCVLSNKVLDIPFGSTGNAIQVQQYDWSGANNQRFILVDAGNGYYNLIAKHSGLALEVSWENKALSAPIVQRADGSSSSSKWKLETAAEASSFADEAFDAYNNAFLITNGTTQYYKEALNVGSKDYFWRQALDIIMAQDVYYRTKKPEHKILIANLLNTFLEQNRGNGGLYDWTWNDYNDDVAWAGIAFARGYQITGNPIFLTQAKYAFNRIYDRGWDNALGGGIWWDVNHESKSGLSNNTAVMLACYIYEGSREQVYLTKANAIYDWIRKTLYNGNTGSVDENINPAGKLTGSYNVYNIGAFIGAANHLHRLTGRESLFDDAKKSVEYVINNKTINGILSNGQRQGTWQTEFARGLGEFVRDNNLWNDYYDWMKKNADAAWEARRTDKNIAWNKWTEITPSDNITTALECAGMVTMLQVVPLQKPGFKDGSTYRFVPKINTQSSLEVVNANAGDGALVQINATTDGAHQKFKTVSVGYGYYRLVPGHAQGSSLDVKGGGVGNDVPIEIFGSNKTTAQYWKIVYDYDGFFKLKPKCAPMNCANISGNNPANLTPVAMYQESATDNERWYMNEVNGVVANGNGDGLTANYFNGMNFETPVYNRKDATVNFDWANGSPNALVNADGFSARWTGQVQPKYSGEYTFYVNSDNGRRLWVNNQLIIDKWVDDWGVEYNGKVTLTAGQKYDIKLEYFENNGGAGCNLQWSSAAQTKEVIPTSQLYSNPLPSLSIASPANNSTFNASANISFTSAVSDNSLVAKVEYYNGALKIGESTTSPYIYTWNNVAVGTYTITSRATDDLGGLSVSAPVTVQVNTVVIGNKAPTVAITSPANNSVFNAPASITIAANATDSDGTIEKVEFYNGTTKLGEDATSPYSYIWTGLVAGTYTVTAKAFDNNNANAVSAAVTVQVNTVVVVNKAPTVSLTSPANNSVLNVPASITISADATDSDGSIAKVEFYNGTTKLGEDATAPYVYIWSNVSAGAYVISAKAFDDKNASTISGSATVTVKTIVTDVCSALSIYKENGGYVAGSKVKNTGKQFECKEWPYSGWCNGAAWAYAPGVGAYWSDAWYEKGSCTSKAGELHGSESLEGLEVVVVPNPVINTFTLASSQDLRGGRVRVLSALGTEVLTIDLYNSFIDVSILPPGVYTVVWSLGDKSVIKHFIK